MMTIRVLIAEDHPAVRAGIRSLLRVAPDIVVVGEASDGREALHLAQEMVPDILLLDIEMPYLTGIDVTRQLHALESPVRILVLSAHDDHRYIDAILANGATGYLTKEEAPEYLIEAIRQISRVEQHWLSPQVRRAMDG